MLYALYKAVDKFVDNMWILKNNSGREHCKMRHNPKRSSKGRHQHNNNNNNRGKHTRTKVYESNGPDSKIRGTAYQITEKYELLAKDAERSGNIVLAENYRQHGEHYQRIINVFEAENEAVQKPVEPKAEDDLGLPASITGVPVETAEVVTV
jgi:hypothetical protein